MSGGTFHISYCFFRSEPVNDQLAGLRIPGLDPSRRTLTAVVMRVEAD